MKLPRWTRLYLPLRDRDWWWNVKNLLTGNPYRSEWHNHRREQAVNYSLDTNGANAQGFFVKEGTAKPSKWFEHSTPSHGITSHVDHGVHKIVYRDVQGNVTEYTPSSASGE